MLFILPATSFADYFDNKYIFGISLIKQYANITTSNSNSLTHDTGSGLGFYFDRYDEQKYRFNGALNYISFAQFDVAEVIISIDHLYPIQTDTSLFAGAAFGFAMQKYDDDGFADAAASLVYGLQFGGIKYISESHLIELGFRIRKTSLNTENDPSTNLVTRINYLNEFYFSTLFMF